MLKRTAGKSSTAPPGRRAPKTWQANAFVAAASVVVALIAGEALLRSTDLRYLRHPNIQYPAGYYREDPVLGTDLAPNRPPAPVIFKGPTFQTHTNALGCFDKEGPIGEGYLLAIGDSSTWGYAPLEDKWTSHLERWSGRRVVKCGVSGTGPEFQRLKAQKIIQKLGIDPALILVLYNGDNDFNDDAVFPGYAMLHGERVQNLKSLDLRTGEITRYTRHELERQYRRYLRRQDSWRQRLVDEFVTVGLLKRGYGILRQSWRTRRLGPLLRSQYEFSLWDVDVREYPWVLGAFADHLQNILALRRMAEAYGAELVLITHGLADHGLALRLRERLARTLRYHVDIDAAIQAAAGGRRIDHPHDGHWNALGNHLAAQAIYRYLIDAELLRPPPSTDQEPAGLGVRAPAAAADPRESERPR